MLTEMLKIVTTAHEFRAPHHRASVLHPIRVMAAMRTEDEELNCIALGHELLNKTTVTINDLVKSSMSDRVIRGIILFKDAGTPALTIENICQTRDTALVGIQCIVDRTATKTGMSKETRLALYNAHRRMAERLNEDDLSRVLGLKHNLL